MQIGKKFNTLSLEEYILYIDNHKKYSDFNTLGLYRSIVENEKLSPEQKLMVRDHAHKFFKKSFEFLQLKDPKTFVQVEYLGQELTKGDEDQVWRNIKKNQQKILADKRIRHRNFGDYSKHNCGRENCIWNGLMIRQGSWMEYGTIHFDGDKNKYQQRVKSDRRRADRKNKRNIIQKDIEN